MTKRELEVELVHLKVPAEVFDLEGRHLPERYTLRADPLGRWSVYYSERGLETGLMEFETEAEACKCLLYLIKTDGDLGQGDEL